MPKASPFKFLDAYAKEDKDIFFGREDEVEKLYELVFQSNITLVYGQSGTGKTSLVQCGLANRFAVTDWFNVYIRRNEDINQSLLRSLQRYEVKEDPLQGSSLRERLMKKRAGIQRTPVAEKVVENELIRSLRSIYKHYLKPVFLIFDQFEELFILGARGEQELFYYSIAQILESEPYCRVILIMREESIAQLHDFERIVPQLFDKRLRVEPMGRTKTNEVISRTTEKFGIGLESAVIPNRIIDALSEGKGRVELTYLQVFLDQLYQEAAKDTTRGIIFTEAQIRRVGGIEDILGDFLERQTAAIQAQATGSFPGIYSAAVRKVLSAFVTLEGTKRPIDPEELVVGGVPKAQSDFIIDQLERSRILRFENNLYELSHDALAKQVAEARSTDEVAILRIAQIVRNRFNEFEATKTLMNRNELQLIEAYRQRLEEEKLIRREEWGFVQKSARADRRRRVSTIAMVASVMLVLAVFGLYSYLLADRVKAEQLKSVEMSYSLFLKSGDQLMAQYKYEEAQEAYRNALKIKKGAEEATNSLQTAISNAQKSTRFDQLIKEGDQLRALGERDPARLVDAREKFTTALQLGVKQSEAQGRLNGLKGELETALKILIENAKTHVRAGGYRYACDNFKLANQIDPGNREVQQGLENCK